MPPSYQFVKSLQMDGAVCDRLFRQAFGYKTDGCFVEVGASNGVDYSFTYELARLGWTGVYVEPVPSLAADCRSNHASHRVSVVEAAAGPKDGDGLIWVIPEWGTATFSETAADEKSSIGKQALDCKVLKLDSILDGAGLPEIDLMVIDVDFGTAEALSGFTLGRWNPKLVIIELHEQVLVDTGKPHSLEGENVAIANRFFASYDKVYLDYINTVFRRK